MERNEIGVWVGIDWADREHRFCIRQEGSNREELVSVPQKGEAIEKLILRLRDQGGEKKIAVAIEASRCPVVDVLSKYDFVVLYLIHPGKFSNYRKAFRCSGAKDDTSDARLLLQYLMTYHEQLRPWVAQDPVTRQLQLLLESRRKLVDDASALSNQMKSILKRYYPEALDFFKLKTQLACSFLLKWPSFGSLKKAQPSTVRTFLIRHGSRRRINLEEILATIACQKPLVEDEAIVKPSVLMIKALATQMKYLLASINEFDQVIEELFTVHSQQKIFKSFPGAAKIMAPRLAVAFGTQMDRFESARQLQQYSGTAPVTVSSGTCRRVHWRWASPVFQRQTAHEYARISIRSCRWAAAFFKMQIMNKKRPQAAIRALAYKWQRIQFRCWKNQQPYREEIYLEALKRKKSPILAYL